MAAAEFFKFAGILSAVSGPITSWQIDGETVADFILGGHFLGAPKSLQIVIAAMKLKHAYSLEGKL